jgi:hypothetical protein
LLVNTQNTSGASTVWTFFKVTNIFTNLSDWSHAEIK